MTNKVLFRGIGIISCNVKAYLSRLSFTKGALIPMMNVPSRKVQEEDIIELVDIPSRIIEE